MPGWHARLGPALNKSAVCTCAFFTFLYNSSAARGPNMQAPNPGAMVIVAKGKHERCCVSLARPGATSDRRLLP